MKNTLVILSLFCAGILGASEVVSTKVLATAFKTANKLAVPLSFNKHEFKFQNTQGSVPDILNNANAVVILDSVDSDKNPLRDKNINDKFFSLFKTKSAKAQIKSVDGDDKKGSFLADIIVNNNVKELKFGYEVSENTIIAKAYIDLANDFGLNNAYDSFRKDKIIEGLHGKKTWSEVEIGFEITLK